ncbi:hypothetical protein DPMN_093526 [Dreissena polymorpha]|uniref:Uncharacterized protein n=1 Tax=Dreissena polymorpha TaxID=45954 RepID=A0A9D4L3H2_DREPO|nr:hypothetical protein DPMN_093526 [Dreissena polymorpha]
MEANTLQSVLRSKYNIDDRLQAEGIFVALHGGTLDAIGLFSIGIGERWVVVAGINLRGPHIDYDLKSLTPVGLLGVTYKNCSRVITISSQFKSKQSFQLCSSRKDAAVWDDFTTAIDCLRSKCSGDIWCSASLTTSSSPDASLGVEHERKYQRHLMGEQRINYRCVHRQRFPTVDVSHSSISLPDFKSGPTDAKHVVWCQHVKRGHSLEMTFDNFVNDNDSNLNAVAQQVSWTAHATLLIGGHTTNDLSTAESTAVSTDMSTAVSSKPHGLAEGFRRFFSCCRTKR